MYPPRSVILLLCLLKVSLKEIDDNDENKDMSTLDVVYVRESLNCFSNEGTKLLFKKIL